MKQSKSDGPADARDRGPDDRRRDQSQHVADPHQPETRAERALDEPCRQHGFTGIAYGEENSAPETSVAEQIGPDGCSHRADNDRPARTGPESDQDAGRDPGGRPEYRNALRLGQQGKTLSRSHEIGDADHRGEDDQASPPRQVDTGGKPLKLSLPS